MWGTFLIVFSVLSLCGTGNAAPPQFSPTQAFTVNVGAFETTERLLKVLTVSDADGDSFVCAIASVVPVGGTPYFDVIWREVKGIWVYGLYVLDGANLGADASYAVKTVCKDLGGASGSAIVDVDIRMNEQIVINLPDIVSMNALTTNKGATVPFTITAADDLHATLKYSLDVWPPSTSFQITADGVITTTQDLRYEIYNPVDLYVTVTDSFIYVTERLRVTFTGERQIPRPMQ